MLRKKRETSFSCVRYTLNVFRYFFFRCSHNFQIDNHCTANIPRLGFDEKLLNNSLKNVN